MTVPRSDTKDQKDGADRDGQEAVDGRNLETGHLPEAARCLLVWSVVSTWRPEGKSPKMLSEPTTSFLEFQVDDTRSKGMLRPYCFLRVSAVIARRV